MEVKVKGHVGLSCEQFRRGNILRTLSFLLFILYSILQAPKRLWFNLISHLFLFVLVFWHLPLLQHSSWKILFSSASTPSWKKWDYKYIAAKRSKNKLKTTKCRKQQMPRLFIVLFLFFKKSSPQQVGVLFLMQPNSPLLLHRQRPKQKPKHSGRLLFGPTSSALNLPLHSLP